MNDISRIETEALVELLAVEMRDLVESGAGLPFVFDPAEAFALLAVLQLALRHPGLAGFAHDVALRLAHNIEQRLGVTPAIREAARRGWFPEHDRGEERDGAKFYGSNPEEAEIAAAAEREACMKIAEECAALAGSVLINESYRNVWRAAATKIRDRIGFRGLHNSYGSTPEEAEKLGREAYERAAKGEKSK
jgi:hypothetical protein